MRDMDEGKSPFRKDFAWEAGAAILTILCGAQFHHTRFELSEAW